VSLDEASAFVERLRTPLRGHLDADLLHRVAEQQRSSATLIGSIARQSA
jgi:hypothetical protein